MSDAATTAAIAANTQRISRVAPRQTRDRREPAGTSAAAGETSSLTGLSLPHGNAPLSGGDPGHEPHDHVGRRLGPGDLAGDAPFAEHENPARQVQHFRHLTRDQNDRGSGYGELVDERVNLGLGADVHAAGRLV